MNVFTFYMLRRLGGAALVGTVGLLVAFWLVYALRFLPLITTGSLGLSEFLGLIVPLLPSFLGQIIPLSLAMATLFIYSRASSDRELLALGAAGLGPLALARPAVLLAVAVTFLSYIMALWVGPYSMQTFRERLWRARYDVSGTIIQEGRFARLGQDVTVYTRKQLDHGVFVDLLLYDAHSSKQIAVFMARRGTLRGGPHALQFLLEDGSRHTVDAKTGVLSVLRFQSYVAVWNLGDRMQPVRQIKPWERSLSDLFSLQEGMEDHLLSARDIRRLRAEGHQRLTYPMTTVSFVLLTLGTFMRGSFNRRSPSTHVRTAGLSLIAAQGSFSGISGLLVLFPGLIWTLYALTIALAVVGLWLLLAPRPRRRLPLRKP